MKTSVFDTWAKSIVGSRDDGKGGHCVLGFLDTVSYHHNLIPRLAAFVREVYPPIQDDYNPRCNGDIHPKSDNSLLACIHNMYALSPSDWRDIDLLTQRTD